MPWKEPGEKPREPRGREPWGPGHGGGHGGGGPDLEAWLRKLRGRFGPFGRGPLGVLALIVLLIVLWFLIGGWTSIGAQQVGVVLRFGRFEGLLKPGVHAHLPAPIDRVEKVDMGQPRTVGDEARLLTSDGQLVLVDYEVQYKVTDARAFLFGSRDAEEVVRDAATAAARAAVGADPLACLIGDLGSSCPSGQVNGKQLADAMRTEVDASLAAVQRSIGIAVTGVSVQNIGVPSDVKPAFDAIEKAHQDAKTARVSAEADVARRKSEEKAQVASIKAGAEAYRRQVVADAHTGVVRFDQVLAQYQAAPQVTRHRLWLQAMQAVLAKNRVVVNTGSGSVIVQFPLQHLGAAYPPAGAATTGAPASAASVPAPAVSAPASGASISIPVTSGPIVKGGA